MLYPYSTLGRTDAEKEVDRLYRRYIRLSNEFDRLLNKASCRRATEADIEAACDLEPIVNQAFDEWIAASRKQHGH